MLTGVQSNGDNSPNTLILFADAISQRLGVYVAVMMVGPLSDGNIGVQSIHLLTNGGCTSKMWPKSDPKGFGEAEKSLQGYSA